MNAGVYSAPMFDPLGTMLKLSRFIRRNLGSLIRLNLLYVAVCLLLVTAGPATTALLRLTRDLSEGRRVRIAADFWSAFADTLAPSALLGGGFAFLMLPAGYAVSFYLNGLRAGQPWMALPLLIAVSGALLLIAAGMVLFLLLATARLPLWRAPVDALLLAVRHPAAGLVCAAAAVAPLLMLLAVPLAGIAFYLFGGFAFHAAAVAGLFMPHVERNVFSSRPHARKPYDYDHRPDDEE